MRSATPPFCDGGLVLFVAMTVLLAGLPLEGLGISSPLSGQSSERSLAALSDKGAYIPAPGSAERRAILETLRQMFNKGFGKEFVFKVKYLKVHNDWAAIVAFPSSRDGTLNLEPLLALLRKKAGAWQIVAFPCPEEALWIDPEFPRKMRARFPEAPPDIIPDLRKIMK